MNTTSYLNSRDRKTYRFLRILFLAAFNCWCIYPQQNGGTTIPLDDLLDAAWLKQIVENVKNDDLKEAGKHSWRLWSQFNKTITVRIPVVNNSLPSQIPIWMSWCQIEDVMKDPGSNGNPKCFGTMIEEATPKPLPIFSQLRARSEYHEKSSARPMSRSEFEAIDSLGQSVETTHFSPELVSALWKLTRDVCGTSSDPSKLVSCFKKNNIKAADAERRINKAIPPTAVVIKANWMVVQAGSSGKPSYLKFPWVWRGAKSLGFDDRARLEGGRPYSGWWGPNVNSVKPISLPVRGSLCPSAQQDLAIPTPINGVKVDQFLYFQYCSDDEALDGVEKGDYLILTGLHIITNAQPDGEWTWSTFHWNDSKYSSFDARRKELLKWRPPELSGWQANYHMDLQYSSKQKLSPDPLIVKAAEKLGSDAPKTCDLGGGIPGGVFNPYIEVGLPCGVFTNCLACHSYAGGQMLEVTKASSRVPRKPSAKDKTVFTHFLWSLARAQK
jgi:hypothetical protein